MSIKEAILKASHILQNQKEARILMSYHVGKDNLYLLLHDNEVLKDPKGYFNLIKRRSLNEPVEYITNSVSFYSREFFIKKGVLIPRPETEILIDKTLKIIQKFKNIKVAEIGVGSGVISIMLALLKKDIKIVATDISKEAIEVAKINAKRFKVEDKITFVKTSFLDTIKEDFDIIISNPPYISNYFEIEKNLTYEPKRALFGGKIGDEILKNIIDLAIKKRVKFLACEMGYDQLEPLKSYMIQKGVIKFEFYKDLSSHDRGFIATLRS